MVSLLFPLLTASALAAQEAAPARVTAVIRLVKHLPKGGRAWLRTAVGTALFDGWRVRTFKRAKCEIRFKDGSFVRLGPESDLTIRPVGPRGRSLFLAIGRLFARIVKGRRYVFRGPTAVAAVRGTEFELVVDPWGRETLRVFSGLVEWWTPWGTVILRGGQESSVEPGRAPEPPRRTPPKEFAGGEEKPFWGDVRPGVSVDVTPGTDAHEEQKDESLTIRTSSAEAAEPESESFGEELKKEGQAAVVIRQAVSQGAFEAEGFGFAQKGRALVGMRLRTKGVVGRTFFDLALMPRFMTERHGRTVVSEAYVTTRDERRGDLRVGRQRFLFGPTNNTLFGSLMKTDVADALTLSTPPGSETSAQVSYLFDAAPFYSGRQSGLYFRASRPALGGYLAVNWLHMNGVGTGATLDFSLPLKRDKLDLYGEFGSDHLGWPVRTFGLYFPDLYQRYGLDLFVEASGRGPLKDVFSVKAYKEFEGGHFGVAVLQKEKGGGWSLGLGFVARGGLPLWALPRRAARAGE